MSERVRNREGIKETAAFYLHCLPKKGGCSYEAESLSPARFCPRCGKGHTLFVTQFPAYQGECRCGAIVTLIDAMEPEKGRLSARGKGFCPSCGRDFDLSQKENAAFGGERRES